MTLSMFDQFLSPVLYGVPLIVVAQLLPLILLPGLCGRWLGSRLLTLQGYFLNRVTKELLLPLGTQGHKWAAVFASLLAYLIILNTMGLLPYTFTPTTQLSLNLGLAVPLWLATVLIGARNKPTHALGHLLPEGTPTLLIPVLIIIETISLFIRPLALGVRLTANLTAGHLLILLMSKGVFVLISIMPAVAILTAIVVFLLTLLELAVALIQAYVFILLLTLYLQENV